MSEPFGNADALLAAWADISAQSRPPRVVVARPQRPLPLVAAGTLTSLAIVVVVALVAGATILRTAVAPTGGPSSSAGGVVPSSGSASTSAVASAPASATPAPSPPAPSQPATPPPTRRPRGWFMTGALVSATDGWAISNEALLLTHDGGRSWGSATTPDNVGGRVAGAAFADALHGWFVREVQTGGPRAGLLVTIYRTDDGAQIWSPVSLPPIPAATADPIDAAPSFSMLSADVGFVALEIGGPAATGHGLLFATTDGGRTWQPRPEPPIWTRWIDFIDPQVGFAAGAADGKDLYRTADGGLTWERTGLESVVEGPVRTDAGRLLVYGSSTNAALGRWFESRDGGASWTAVGEPQPGFVPATVLDDRHWLVARGSKLSVTTDGGGSWSAVDSRIPGTIGRLAAVDASHVWAIVSTPRCPAGQFCVLVTAALWASDDGGQTWRDATP